LSVILKLVHPLAIRIRARWVWSRGRRYLVYGKLDPVKVAWIIRQKENGARNDAIASSMGVSVSGDALSHEPRASKEIRVVVAAWTAHQIPRRRTTMIAR
jgi:hypothetical protein